jgi:hypothetical protein
MKGLTTLVLHTPLRPRQCLPRTLESLKKATAREPHLVEVVVQGKPPDGRKLPDPGDYPYDLRYVHHEVNIGIGAAFHFAAKRFLERGHQRLAKVDDDIAVPVRGWDALEKCLDEEKRLGEENVQVVMMATAENQPKMWKIEKREGQSDALSLVVGHKALRKLEGGPHWFVCDLCDIGCTMWERSVFEQGFLPPAEYLVGGITLDHVWDRWNAGIMSALCVKPRCDHMAGGCGTVEYEEVRRGARECRRSGAVFHAKWGIEFPELTNYRR